MPRAEDETFDHLYIAEQNRQLALVMLGPDAALVRPRRAEWAGVVAFYAAVHYVNAYLWEARRFVPVNHHDRNQAVLAEAQLRPVRESYRLLRSFAFSARYEAPFTATEAEAHDLIDVDLRNVESVVLRALRIPVPTWQLPAPR